VGRGGFVSETITRGAWQWSVQDICHAASVSVVLCQLMVKKLILSTAAAILTDILITCFIINTQTRKPVFLK
jgi:hypothetical protein